MKHPIVQLKEPFLFLDEIPGEDLFTVAYLIPPKNPRISNITPLLEMMMDPACGWSLWAATASKALGIEAGF